RGKPGGQRGPRPERRARQLRRHVGLGLPPPTAARRGDGRRQAGLDRDHPAAGDAEARPESGRGPGPSPARALTRLRREAGSPAPRRAGGRGSGGRSPAEHLGADLGALLAVWPHLLAVDQVPGVAAIVEDLVAVPRVEIALTTEGLVTEVGPDVALGVEGLVALLKERLAVAAHRSGPRLGTADVLAVGGRDERRQDSREGKHHNRHSIHDDTPLDQHTPDHGQPRDSLWRTGLSATLL